MNRERTLVLVKPDGVVRNLVGKIISRFEDAGLKIVGMKMAWVEDEFAKKHYMEDIAERHGERVRNDLIEYVKEGPVVAMVLEGVEGISITRKIVGDTYPSRSQPGTIRGDFAHISKDYANTNEIMVKNLIHASGDKEDAEREIKLWFKDEEMHNYKTVHDMIAFDEK